MDVVDFVVRLVVWPKCLIVQVEGDVQVVHNFHVAFHHYLEIVFFEQFLEFLLDLFTLGSRSVFKDGKAVVSIQPNVLFLEL